MNDDGPWPLPADAAAPAHARRLLETALSTWSDPSDAVLIASELVANMVRHGEAPYTLQAEVTYQQLHLTATNVQRTPSSSPHVVQAGSAAVNGRGLAIVSQLSDQWGWTQADGLTTVWAAVTGTLSADAKVRLGDPVAPTR